MKITRNIPFPFDDTEFTNVFLNHLKSGDIIDIIPLLLKFTSKEKLSVQLGSSPRSIGRYIKRRKMPMHCIKKLVQLCKIDELVLLEAMCQDTETYCKEFLPKTAYNKVVWYGKCNDLVNSLFFIRTQIHSMSLFEFAYKIEIDPAQLAKYECGKTQIPPKEVEKILNHLNISITALFPQLCSFDNGASYIPLSSVSLKNSEGRNWNDFYIDEYEFEMINCIQEWPINRYNNLGEIISTTMPDKLSMDEYYNTNDILFYNTNNDNYYKGPQFDYKTLPPNYYRYQTIYIDGKKTEKNHLMKQKLVLATDVEIGSTDVITIKFENGSSCLLDLGPYINSLSLWYQELKDLEYRKQAQLRILMPSQNDTQVIIWPHGQYIRIDELPMDMNPYSSCFIFKSIRHVEPIHNWICWI